MRFLRLLAILTIPIIPTILTACGSPQNSGNTPGANSAPRDGVSAQNKANTNAEELGMLINFAWETEDLAWKKDEAKKTLIAVIRVSPENAKKLTDEISAGSAGAPKEVSVEEWFPAELVAQGESAGGSSVEGTAYPATMLFQPPYEQGTISRINGTDFFVIELSPR